MRRTLSLVRVVATLLVVAGALRTNMRRGERGNAVTVEGDGGK